MNVTLCSSFRNASGYLDRYTEQVKALACDLFHRGHTLGFIWCEGDSTDNTRELLSAIARNFAFRDAVGWVYLFDHNHGGAEYGSVVHPQRFKQLAGVCNAIWARIPANADAVIWVESDLVWEPATMLALLDDLKECPAVAPMVMLEREGYPQPFFYDSWAFRRNGANFAHHPPYAPLTVKGHCIRDHLENVDSAGSCLVMRGDIARQVSWPEEDVIVGLCRNIYEVGGSVWLDATQKVVHL